MIILNAPKRHFHSNRNFAMECVQGRSALVVYTLHCTALKEECGYTSTVPGPCTSTRTCMVWCTLLASRVQSTSLITTFGGASKKCPYSRSVIIPEVSLYVLQLEGTLLGAWTCCRYSRIVVISAVVISQVDCT